MKYQTEYVHNLPKKKKRLKNLLKWCFADFLITSTRYWESNKVISYLQCTAPNLPHEPKPLGFCGGFDFTPLLIRESPAKANGSIFYIRNKSFTFFFFIHLGWNAGNNFCLSTGQKLVFIILIFVISFYKPSGYWSYLAFY